MEVSEALDVSADPEVSAEVSAEAALPPRMPRRRPRRPEPPEELPELLESSEALLSVEAAELLEEPPPELCWALMRSASQETALGTWLW